MAEVEKPYQFRPYVKEDLNFIQSSWASSYYKGANYQDLLSPEAFHAHHRPIRDKILANPASAIIICVSKLEDLIIGWILVESPKPEPGLILHYLYTKQAFKGEGIAKELLTMALPTRPIMMSHMTEKAQKIMHRNKEKYQHFYHAPHLI